MTPEQRAYRNLWMRELGAPVPESAANIPGRNALMRAGVRQWVANEYRRLLTAGVNPQTAGILARSPARSYSRQSTACGQPIHKYTAPNHLCGPSAKGKMKARPRALTHPRPLDLLHPESERRPSVTILPPPGARSKWSPTCEVG